MKKNKEQPQMTDMFESQTDENIEEMTTDELLEFVRPYNLCYVDNREMEIAGWHGIQHWACCMTQNNMHYEQNGDTARESLINMAKYMIKNHIHRRGN